MKTLIFDLETNGLLDSLNKIWCAGIANPETGEVKVYSDYSDDYPSLEEGLKELQNADRVVAHNLIGFDYQALEKLYPGTIKFEQLWDSIVVAALLEPDMKSHSIAAYGEMFGAPKGDYKDFDNFSQDMIDYMIRDVEINVQIYNRLQNLMKRDLVQNKMDWRQSIDIEHKVQWCLSLQERHGFRIDMPKAYEVEGQLRQEQKNIEAELQEIFPPQFVPQKGNYDWAEDRWANVEVKMPKVNRKPQGITKGVPYCNIVEEAFNPGSRQQIVRRIKQKYPKWMPTSFTPSGIPEINETILSNMPIVEAKALNRYFKVSKQLGQIADGKNSWLKLEKDGRIHGRVKSVGCRTHRMSHFMPNTAQVDKDKALRGLWVANEGEKLVGCDASGLELRMLAHYLAIWDDGAYAKAVIEGNQKDGTDAHTRTKELAGLYDRNSAKTLIYALLYGAGNQKLSDIVVEDAKNNNQPVPKGRGYKLGKATRDKLSDGIVGLGKLVAVSQARDKKQGWLKGLDGRKVHTNGQHGALNTLLQSAGAIVMKLALAELHFNLGIKRGLVDPQTYLPIGWNYCANVHDEIQCSAQEDIADKLGQTIADSIAEAGKVLNLRCELAGEYDVGDNWSETH